MKFHIERYAQVDSTMTVARTLARNGAPHGTVVVADIQSAGRGRRGREWFSPADAGLWLTLALRPPAGALHTLALVAGCAVHDALKTLGAANVLLKWPNDVVIDARKLAGILLEAELLDGNPLVLIGVGINLLPRTALPDLPQDLDARYIGLMDVLNNRESGVYPLREELLQTVLQSFDACYNEWMSLGLEPLLTKWHGADALRGHLVRADGAGGRSITGRALGLNEQGELLVQSAEGVVAIGAGEVEKVRSASDGAHSK